MAKIGYSYLYDAFKLPVFEPKFQAEVAPSSSRIEKNGFKLLVPKTVAPASEHPLDHVLFALKHEGVNLQILSEVLPKITPDDIRQRLVATPNGEYIRKIGHLWEQFTGRELENTPTITAPYTNIFDEKRYLTGEKIRDPKWKVDFNGLGSLEYCPIVERTERIEIALAKDILGQTRTYLEGIDAVTAERALSWAYLSETESSYAIEGEAAGDDRSRRFMKLMLQAHDQRDLSEEYLCELQSQTVSSVFDKAYAFRNEQNWLSRSGRRGATYVPPAPDLLHELMPKFMDMANHLPKRIEPIVAASIASFGFVYLHPFMDGNGRLSRFLFHQELCKSGQLEKGFLLPVSVAMKENEIDYLHTLEAFSKPARDLWQVTWLDQEMYDFKFNGSDSIYKYWDATEHVEFGFGMSEKALNKHLKNEVLYLNKYDEIVKQVSKKFDIRGNVLNHLAICCIDQEGAVSKNQRKRYQYMVPEEVFDYIERVTKRVLNQSHELESQSSINMEMTPIIHQLRKKGKKKENAEKTLPPTPPGMDID